jgi:hypothetical protein
MPIITIVALIYDRQETQDLKYTIVFSQYTFSKVNEEIEVILMMKMMVTIYVIINVTFAVNWTNY